MLKIVNRAGNHTDFSNTTDTKECLPVMKGEYHPEIPYSFEICTDNDTYIDFYVSN